MTDNNRKINYSKAIKKKVAPEIRAHITNFVYTIECDDNAKEDINDLLLFKIDNRIGSMYETIRKAVVQELKDRIFKLDQTGSWSEGSGK